VIEQAEKPPSCKGEIPIHSPDDPGFLELFHCLNECPHGNINMGRAVVAAVPQVSYAVKKTVRNISGSSSGTHSVNCRVSGLLHSIKIINDSIFINKVSAYFALFAAISASVTISYLYG
jgi:hypothetical protein